MGRVKRGRRGKRKMAGVAGLEPVTSAVTGQRSNQLSYTPAAQTRRNLRSPTLQVKSSSPAQRGFGRQTPRRWGWGTPLKKRAATRTLQILLPAHSLSRGSDRTHRPQVPSCLPAKPEEAGRKSHSLPPLRQISRQFLDDASNGLVLAAPWNTTAIRRAAGASRAGLPPHAGIMSPPASPAAENPPPDPFFCPATARIAPACRGPGLTSASGRKLLTARYPKARASTRPGVAPRVPVEGRRTPGAIAPHLLFCSRPDLALQHAHGHGVNRPKIPRRSGKCSRKRGALRCGERREMPL